ncbi:hypothetical protein OVS_01510 [Mycoplasma ovis str. Michigan]|uniref:Lipoprotein n=1 Tax=Mycoplasma ovis str. Michigan TaxID=1415773 RepID=A0ABM5P165_9MOLU|nr:hypothetical protein [Mycoplasma ovis]AHC40209.1 hypothetical protein OVS_01510 [Mycoplasma ovis str. Michigan]
MSVAVKFLSTSAVVCAVGGCIGLPLFLRSSTTPTQEDSAKLPSLQSTSSQSTTSTTFSSGNTSENEEVKSIVWWGCNITNLERELEQFLKDKSKKQDDYVEVICKSTGVDKEKDTIFSDVWTGLFPKVILSKQSLEGGGEKFELTIKESQEESDLEKRSITWETFSGTGVKETIRGRLDLWDDKSPKGKRVDSVSIQEGNYQSNVIYLVFPRTEEVDSK